jgi:hypothetical protein
MPGRGPAPKAQRRNKSDKPTRGEWQPTRGVGWQHGPAPEPPEGLMDSTRHAWQLWMAGSAASMWGPEDVPALRLLARTFDQVERGDFTRAGESRLLMDTYGITPKGRQERRWADPTTKPTADAPSLASPYLHLLEDPS